MDVTSELEAGNGEVQWNDGEEAGIEVRSDPDGGVRQWFHVRVDQEQPGPVRLVVANAGECSYPDGFEDYKACASYDGKRWFRVPTSYDGDRLIVEHTPHGRTVQYAYFACYGAARRARLQRKARRASFLQVRTLGTSGAGRPIDALTFGPMDAPRHLWVVARQHSGEAMAEWLAEGLVERLLDDEDETVRAVLREAAVHVVTCANPDGVALGHQRANAAGYDPNRAWSDPTGVPEIAAIRAAMEQTGVDLFVDVHGDERNPFCFLAGCEGNPSYSERLRGLENVFEQALCAVNPDFQDEYGYDRDAPGEGDLRTASNWVGETFDCLSYTLEMPFKDNANAPDETRGWSPDRSMYLGQDLLDAMAASLPTLR